MEQRRLTLRTKQTIVVLAMVAGVLATIVATAYPAQAQQEIEVTCLVEVGGGSLCLRVTPPFAGEFECEPSQGAVGTASQCTHRITGETFGCEIVESTPGVASRHQCTIPGSGGAGGGGTGFSIPGYYYDYGTEFYPTDPYSGGSADYSPGYSGYGY